MRAALSVWWRDRIAGEFLLDDNGDIGFIYEKTWVTDPDCPPISAWLPKQEDAFTRSKARPFFAGLLPEAGVLDRVARNLGVSKTNDFKLLQELGGDVAGALTLWPKGQTPPVYDGAIATAALSDAELVGLLDDLPKRPLLAGEQKVRLSLAGAQAKVPVVLVEDRIALPAPGQPTTHILKSPMKDYPASTENEAFAMSLAHAVGLDVALAAPRRALSTGDRTSSSRVMTGAGMPAEPIIASTRRTFAKPLERRRSTSTRRKAGRPSRRVLTCFGG